MKDNKILMIIIAVLVEGGLGFFGGMRCQQSMAPARGAFGASGSLGARSGSGAQRFGTAGSQGFRPVMGQVINEDITSITVKMNDGSSRIVVISGSTTFNKAAQASFSDIKVGDTVRVSGIVNSDGSVTAQDVQLNPILGQFTAGGSAPSGQ